MTIIGSPPWLADSIARLDVRRGERLLLLTSPPQPQTAALCRMVGQAGRVLVVEPDRQAAMRTAAAEHPCLEVVSCPLTGRERFGTFDALLAGPLSSAEKPDLWSSLAIANLRPGARFVVDLPAENLCPVLAQCWLDAGGPPGALVGIQGAGEAELAAALQRAGLRGVEGSPGVYLVKLESAFVLAQLAAELMVGGDDMRASLELALVQKLETNGPIEVIFRRSQAHGIR